MIGSFFARIFRRAKKIQADFKSCQGILIRPDGSWIVIDKNKENNEIKQHPYAPPTGYKQHTPTGLAHPTLGKAINWLAPANADHKLENLSAPPSYFPQSKELYSKLEQCLDLDIISSCVHKQSDQNTYILSIELPCLDAPQDNMKRFKIFIKTMEDLYKFKTIQQERINSSTCNEQYYLVVFEYDPKQFILKKLDGA